MKISKVTTQPTVEPITLSEMKEYLKIDPTDTSEDGLISRLIKEGRQWCEERTNRSLLLQTRSQYQDCFYHVYRDKISNPDGCIELLHGPLLSVDSVYVNYIKYYDENDVQQTLSSSDYWVDSASRIPRIFIKNSWPTTEVRPNAVEISYNAGFGISSSDIPGYYLRAIELYVTHFFENRNSEVSGVDVARFQMGLERVLDMGTVYQNGY